MSEIIHKEDTPVAVIHDPMNPQTPYVILDVKGVMRAQFVSREEADAFAETVNAEEVTKEKPGDNEVERDQEDPEQQEEEEMPTGIPNKKKAVKKRVAAAKSKVKKRAATAVKKVVKKVKKAAKKKAAKRFKY